MTRRSFFVGRPLPLTRETGERRKSSARGASGGGGAVTSLYSVLASYFGIGVSRTSWTLGMRGQTSRSLSTRSSDLMIRCGLETAPLTLTRPAVQACVAWLRVLKSRAT